MTRDLRDNFECGAWVLGDWCSTLALSGRVAECKVKVSVRENWLVFMLSSLFGIFWLEGVGECFPSFHTRSCGCTTCMEVAELEQLVLREGRSSMLPPLGTVALILGMTGLVKEANGLLRPLQVKFLSFM